MNIYVFQFSMPVEDARGFVLADSLPYVIAVNTKDIIEARLFSLIHEFGHILLGKSVIDLPDATSTAANKIEKWCNAFSASFLLPKETANSAFNENKDVLTEKKTIKTLSRRFKVSKAMLVLKMRKLNFIQQKEYEAVLDRYKPGVKRKKEKKAQAGGGIPSDKKTLAEVGNKFVSLVANNYDKEFITYTDALNYLSIKSRNFDKVLARAKK